jgi:hypothetical protein
MPLVDTATLLRVADRAAYQYGQIKATCAVISAPGLEYYWETVTATDDPDVELPTLANYEATDRDFSPAQAAVRGTFLPCILGGMDAHFDGAYPNGGVVLQPGGWDGYLTAKNVRVSQYFAELFFACKGSYMIANNVFSEGNDQFARAQVAAGPVVVFTDGINYGNGSAFNPANGTFFAATQLRVVVTVKGAVNLDLRLSVKDINDMPTTIDVTVPAGSAPGTVVAVGTSADRFLDVIGIGFVPAGSKGTAGDDVTVRNLKERQIQL